MSMVILSGTMVIQTYFAVSGFLLAMRFGGGKVKVRHVIVAIVYRLMR